ncbi:MAG: hypothetical protein FWC42_09510 [Proteobacteria bacterium]|nr:hypothetical protein [Pseudomonadota bacterium]MCL2310486.1 hypothetical protein [Pseudomonadota bacterium]
MAQDQNRISIRLQSYKGSRNSGQLLGRLDDLLPFIFLTHEERKSQNLATVLKDKRQRFFTAEFDPLHRDMIGRYEDADPEEKLEDKHHDRKIGFVQTKDRMLNPIWLAPGERDR